MFSSVIYSQVQQIMKKKNIYRAGTWSYSLVVDFDMGIALKNIGRSEHELAVDCEWI